MCSCPTFKAPPDPSAPSAGEVSRQAPGARARRLGAARLRWTVEHSLGAVSIFPSTAAGVALIAPIALVSGAVAFFGRRNKGEQR